MLRALNLTKKTGFRISNPAIPVIIRDSRGMMFYTTEPMLPRVKRFNLPHGNYFVDSGYFTPMEKPVKFKRVKLPPAQREFPKPWNFKIIYANNPNKCSIFWNRKLIVFDSSFKDKPRFIVEFILSHEIGHAKFETEKFADAYAANLMLKMGYNPSQIGVAPLLTLSGVQLHRKEFMVNNLIKK